MKLDQLREAPISSITHVGDFTQDHSFSDPADRNLVTKPRMVTRIHDFFKNTTYDFNLVFVNLPGAEKHLDTGKIGPIELGKTFPKEVVAQMQIRKAAINIIFTSNEGTGKVPMTPWIIAHRISHGLSKTPEGVFADDRNAEPVARDIYNAWHFIREILTNVEQAVIRDTDSRWQLAIPLVTTVKSGRTGNLRSSGELLHEYFAQYILRGTVSFNKVGDRYVDELIDGNIQQINSSYSRALKGAVGNIYLI